MTQQVFPVEALDKWLRKRLLDVHTAMPCRVLAYDATKQTVDVRPQVAHFLVDENGDREAEELPDLYGVPMSFPRGGGFHVTLPIAADDYVLVIFSEEPTIAWRSKGREVGPGMLQRHGLNGAFAIPCGYPDTDKISPAPSGDNLVIGRDGESGDIVVTPSGSVLIGSDATKECARKSDPIEAIIPSGTVVVSVSGGSGSAAVGTLNPTDITLVGEITGGSAKLKVSD